MNRTIKEKIEEGAAQQRDSNEIIRSFIFQYRLAPNSTTDRTPFEVFTKKMPNEPLSYILRENRNAREISGENIERRQQRTAIYTDMRRGAAENRIKRGDVVRVKRMDKIDDKPKKVVEVGKTSVRLNDGGVCLLRKITRIREGGDMVKTAS